MNAHRLLPFVALLLPACPSPTYDFTGYKMADYFPVSGTRLEIKYNNQDESVPWTLLVEKKGTQMVDSISVVTMEHSNYDSGDVQYAVFWSADSSKGIMIHGYQNADASEVVEFDTPVVFGPRQMLPDEVVTTSTNGYTFTSTLAAIEGCATYWAEGWGDENCLRLELDDGDGDPATNGEITGTYWLVPEYGIALMQLGAYTGTWSMVDWEWSDQEGE